MVHNRIGTGRPGRKRLLRATQCPAKVAAVDTLAPGFLIAMPQLGDPNFHRAVILVVEHNDRGSMGLILNRSTALTLKEFAKSQSLALAPLRKAEPVFLGGPVERERGFLLHDSVLPVERTEVAPGLFLSVTVDALQPLLMDGDCRLRFCLGYAGWGPGQIERELAEGSWLFSEAQREAVLGQSPDDIWESALKTLGVAPAMLQVVKGVQ